MEGRILQITTRKKVEHVPVRLSSAKHDNGSAPPPIRTPSPSRHLNMPSATMILAATTAVNVIDEIGEPIRAVLVPLD